MPLIIDDIIEDAQATGAAKKTGPAFPPSQTFHKDLTGSGGKAGRLNDQVHPANPDLSYQPYELASSPSKETDGDAQVRTLTTEPLLTKGLVHAVQAVARVSLERKQAGQTIAQVDALPYLYRFGVPEHTALYDLDPDLGPLPQGYRLWLGITPQTVVLRNRKVLNELGDTVSDNTTHVYYRVEVYAFAPGDHQGSAVDEDGNAFDVPSIERVAAVTDLHGQHPLDYQGVASFVVLHHAYDVVEALDSILPSVVSYLSNGASTATAVKIDEDRFQDYSRTQYGLFERVCRQAEVLRTDAVVDVVSDFVGQLYAHEADSAARAGKPLELSTMAPAAVQLRFLEHFDVPLEAYSKIYAFLIGLDQRGAISQALIKQNMQLALNGNLQDLAAMRASLNSPTPPQNYALDPRYSLQQTEAITTTEPLVIVQAGAGTGKSTTILERISFLTASGVDPKNITVLSFTNAAADNITLKNPQVVSKTIAKMIHEVYAENFPKHELSTIDTIINSLDIYYGTQMQTSGFMATLRRILQRALTEASNSSMTELTSFIERYTDETIQVLDTIGQSSLELEIILCYLRIADLNEPFDSPEYLIIDEVQDNSAMEFVYSLKYAAKHAASLYLVGDSSQTLYEFRAANPKALNALEGSGVFASYRLTTNYRSKQEILDFANIALYSIEANRYAKIQLQANSLDESTEKSFTDTVQLYNHSVSNQADYVKSLPAFLRDADVRQRLDAHIAAGEPTCLLAYSRNEVRIALETLQEMYPQQTVANLTNDRPFKSTTFTSFISKFWDQVTAVPPTKAAFVFVTQVKNNLAALEKNAAKVEPMVVAALSAWWLENQVHIDGWLNMLAAQPAQLTNDEFFLRLRHNIIDYEIRNNAVRQSMTSQRNEERKNANAAAKPLLMVSTIHGTKGLEFDHTIVLRKPDPNRGPIPEDTKRLYYVALTRARKTEMVITGSAAAYPRIVSDYEMVVAGLAKRDEERVAAQAAADLAALGSISGDEDDGDAVAAPVSQIEDGDPAVLDPEHDWGAGTAPREDSEEDLPLES